MKDVFYMDDVVWTGIGVGKLDPRWDHNLPTCHKSVPASVLRYIANRCASFSEDGGDVPTTPSGKAGQRLHAMLCGFLNDDGGEATAKGMARIAASMLMGLAEEGSWTP